MLSLLFGFHGRINRAKYWFGSLLIGFAGFLAIGLLLAIASGGAVDAKTKGQQLAIFGACALMLAPVLALMAWSGFAIQVKRFHDRGRSGWLASLPLVVGTAMMLTLLGAIAGQTPPLALVAQVEPYAGVLWLINLAFFIDLGCLPGKQGPNRYGDQPGLSGMSKPSPSAGQPSPGSKPAGASLGMQAAMERAIAQRGALGSASAKAGALPKASSAQAPAAAFAPASPSAVASQGPRGFGRRPTR